MKPSMLKRALPVAMAILLLFASGCGKSPEAQTATDVDEVPLTSGGNTVPQSGSAATSHGSLYTVDGATTETSNETYASDTENVNAVLVEKLGILTMTNTDIDKTADVSGDYTSGINAAVAVISKAQLTMNTSTVTTNAKGAVGLAVSAEGTQMSINDSSIYTSGESSPALLVREDAAASVTGGTLSTEGADSPCILLLGGRLTLSGVTLSSKSGETVRMLSGDNFLTLDKTAVTAMTNFAEDATLSIHLSNGASFSGDLGGGLPARASVYLDASGKLILTAETYLTSLVNADLTHQNIESTGFNLYYDSNAQDNAYLNGQSFMLPGGGFLAPII